MLAPTSLSRFFYDQTCAKKADQFISLSPFKTTVVSVAALNPSAPSQGAILLSSSSEHDNRRSIAGFYETVVTAGSTKFYWSEYLRHGKH